GLGNYFAGMGRELGLLFPELLRHQDLRSDRLRDQFLPEHFWGVEVPARFEDHRIPIVAQVAVGSLVTDILRLLGVTPDAAIGYSMGESSALVSLGAWNDRDELHRRLRGSILFATELAGPCDAARRAWGLRPDEQADWLAGIVSCPAALVEDRLDGRSRVHILIKNTDEETVIGGLAAEVRAVAKALGVPFLELPTVSTVHCPVGAVVEPAYRALHDLPTTAPEGVTFYSGVWGRPYRPDREGAREAITAQATGVIDFPTVVRRAYDDGVRIFLEAGPGGSCTRLIGRILGDRPHLALAACLPDPEGLGTLLEVLARLIACRVPVDLGPLYGLRGEDGAGRERPEDEPSLARSVTIDVGPPPWVRGIQAPRRPPTPPPGHSEVTPFPAVPIADVLPVSPMQIPREQPTVITSPGPIPSFESRLAHQVLQGEAARAASHESFLRVTQDLSRMMARTLTLKFEVLEAPAPAIHVDRVVPDAGAKLEARIGRPTKTRSAESVRALDRRECLEFAVGSIAAVLGPEFAPVDAYPTRVRLPDEPLMLVDRIVSIEGRPLSMTGGRVVTEHDILEGAWYLDAGRIPPCIAIESGQADLFLSGYLGIDFLTRGLAVYRLLDATVTFHRGLPRPGQVIRYDIRITRFFRQGETHLFRFEFDGTVNGEPLLTMRDGCAGFFSAEELAAGKGIVPRPLDARPRAGVRPADWTDLVRMMEVSLDERQVDALRRGALAEAFGPPFNRLDLADPLPLPGGRMTLVHRVETLDPQGGRFGLGLIRAEADIRPDDWFMVCHFIDDRVMPGTLMYECCLHTLRIFLMRMGWIGSSGRVAYEPVPGVANRLRCRGQVIESTGKVTYEVVIKELGYAPAPYAIADALMYADGKPIVEISDMALRLSGTDRSELTALWERARRAEAETAGAPTGHPSLPVADGPRPVYGKDQILAFALGKPSDCFGDRYRPFDDGRFIARLPAPPYSFLDRIAAVEGEPWEMRAGTMAEAEYDIPADAWYFDADRQEGVPYAVLLEAALQSCGWVAAYMGSALRSDGPLKFRNLGGTATQHARVGRASGKLHTLARATKVTRSSGMIIQHYDFSVRSDRGPVFEGETYFGFFHPDALARQVGIREASPYAAPPDEVARRPARLTPPTLARSPTSVGG
ncbi:MAG: type I polyketide synthase, partial [Isosphaeraceae bacterium]